MTTLEAYEMGQADVAAWLYELSDRPPNPNINPEAFVLQAECCRNAARLVENGSAHKGIERTP